MKIVVDTSVVISGTFFGGAPRRVVETIGKKEIKACHALFDLEDFHGLHPVKINGRYYLEFSGPTLLQKNSIHELENESFLRKWAEEREKWLPERRDTEEETIEKRKQYDLWRYEYPRNVARETTERLKLRQKKARLEQELKAVNEELGE